MAQDGIDNKPFFEMCFLDYLIENFDRHLNNWGFTVHNATQKIVGFSPIWDNGMSLDFQKPKDLRKTFNFSSFNLSYDFVKDCDYTKDFKERTEKLLKALHLGSVQKELKLATQTYYPQPDLIEQTAQFLTERCHEFLKPLS